MRAIGNDVVDLGDPESAAGACHARFDGRVFAPEELAALDASSSAQRLRLRWTLWAAKEAAYKVARKHDATIVFSPRRFVVRLHDPARATVEHHDRRFTIALETGARHVHAIARDGRIASKDLDDAVTSPGGAARVVVGVAPLAAGSRACPGDAARALAITTVAPMLERAAHTLTIVRDGRIPRLCDAQGPLDTDVSLSHHGRFVAFACVLPTQIVEIARREVMS
jgi:phosphopantetheinyl transferase (holo-ACP synthase)